MSRAELRNDRVELMHSQEPRAGPWWQTKVGALVAVSAVCAVVMVVAAGVNFSGAANLKDHEDDALGNLKHAIDTVLKYSSSSTTSSTTPTSPVTPPAPACPAVNDTEKFDCHPEQGATEERCQKRGCCWKAVPQVSPTYENPAPVNISQCYFPKNYNGYRTQQIVQHGDGLEFQLFRQFPSGLPRDEIQLTVRVKRYDYQTARITIDRSTGGRWIPPLPPIADRSTDRDVGYSVVLEGPTNSTLSIYRGGDVTKKPLFSVSLSTLIFSDQFIQITTSLPSNKVYGLGEMKGHLLHSVNWTRRILFNKDQPPRFNRALYGAHALMVNLNEDNVASGVFIKNSNPMDVVLQPTPAATYRTIGGILDFFVFTGPRPGDVFAQYQRLVGLPAMVPYWSLGYHLCRYGYWTLKKTMETYQRNVDAKVPLEVQWNDIDYMDRFNMFTYDKDGKYKGLPDFVKKVHDEKRKYVMIFDPAVSGSEKDGTYPPFDVGMKMDVFVKNISGTVVRYKVWNDQSSIFPDFSNPRTEEFWRLMFTDFHKQIDFDGAWIDMNEPSNQLNGTKDTHTCLNTSLDYPPVNIGGEDMFTFTACLSDKTYLGPLYDVHNLYPHFEARATYKALTSVRPNKRPFIISRASSPGQGLWSGHWTGDIDSTWADMRQSIPDIINFAMYGMPMLGADICGFQYNTTMQLCARWQALGAFYPFTRNHNDKDRPEQDPAFLGGDVLTATKNTLRYKYLFAPYLYTLMYRAHAFGETVARAMMFNFPEDPQTHALDEQFMWSDGLLIVPALYENQTDVSAYLPAGVWYHFNDNGTKYPVATGGSFKFAAPITDINLFLRGGTIFPVQEASENTLSGNRQNGFMLYVALDENKSAHGELFWDDGETLDTVEKGLYSLIEFDASFGTVITRPIATGYSGDSGKDMTLKTISLFGVDQAPTSIIINGKTLDKLGDHVTYNATTKYLCVHSFTPLDLLGQANAIVIS